MTNTDLRLARENRGWTQQQAAVRLGVSQPYLSLLEKGSRRVPERLSRKFASAYNLSATTLPMEENWDASKNDNKTLAGELSALGYPGLSYLKSGRRQNPAPVIARALRNANLETRLVEALPWILLQHPELDWEWLIREAKVNDLQNKLGFLTNVAQRLAKKLGRYETAAVLRRAEAALEGSRLVREETLCRESLTQAERRWLRSHRSSEARHWNLLTDLSPENLNHVVEDNS